MAINGSHSKLVFALGSLCHSAGSGRTLDSEDSNGNIQQSVSGPEHATLKLAEAMPEVNYSFVPTAGKFSGLRNFAQLVKHIAVDNYMMGEALLGENVPIEVGVHENGPDGIRTKAQTTKFL